MLTLGNYVKVDVSNCRIESCSQGHTPHHHNFHGRVGRLFADIRELAERHKETRDPEIMNHPISCDRCDEFYCLLGEMIYEKDHYFGVSFDGEISRFAPWELRDMGSDLSQSVTEAIGEPILAGAAT